jgi:HAD superfamily hydrolase (TIGR01509 family)
MFSKIKALIFDLDDTLVETEQLNVELISSYFQEIWDMRLDNIDKEIVFGHSWRDIYRFIITKYDLPMSIYEVQEAILERKRVYLKENTLKVATGVDLVIRLPIRKVIVSGSGREEIKMTVENVNLHHCFERIFSADDYPKGKPEPDGFLSALNYLGLPPDEVLAFEDSESGIEAIKAAGITAVFMKEFARSDCSIIAGYSYENFKAFYENFVKFFKA